MSRCQCSGLAAAFYLDQAPLGWSEGLTDVAKGNWKTLRHCRACQATFSIDDWDKFHEQVVVRIPEPSNWEEHADSAVVRKRLLLQSRGGLIVGDCICLGCSEPRVRDIAYCLEHLWETGARR
jgi:hypothetical protein